MALEWDEFLFTERDAGLAAMVAVADLWTKTRCAVIPQPYRGIASEHP